MSELNLTWFHWLDHHIYIIHIVCAFSYKKILFISRPFPVELCVNVTCRSLHQAFTTPERCSMHKDTLPAAKRCKTKRASKPSTALMSWTSSSSKFHQTTVPKCKRRLNNTIHIKSLFRTDRNGPLERRFKILSLENHHFCDSIW